MWLSATRARSLVLSLSVHNGTHCVQHTAHNHWLHSIFRFVCTNIDKSKWNEMYSLWLVRQRRQQRYSHRLIRMNLHEIKDIDHSLIDISHLWLTVWSLLSKHLVILLILPEWSLWIWNLREKSRFSLVSCVLRRLKSYLSFYIAVK